MAAARSFDDLCEGERFSAGPRRVPREDIDAFTVLSGDRTALHSDDRYAATTPFGRVVAHGALNLAVATGLAYESGVFEGTVLAVRSMSIDFERPVFPDDLVSLRFEVLRREAHPRPDRGLVDFRVALVNQEGRQVLSGTWSLLLRRGPAATAPLPAAGTP